MALSQAGPVTVRPEKLSERLVAMTFRKAGFMDWRGAEAECKELRCE